jgi:hypothetical protein
MLAELARSANGLLQESGVRCRGRTTASDDRSVAVVLVRGLVRQVGDKCLLHFSSMILRVSNVPSGPVRRDEKRHKA